MNKKQILTFIEKNGTVIILGGFLVLSSIVGFAIYYLWERDPGPTGDAFNGLVGPFIALLSAILVYRSFVAQTEANKQQTAATIDQIKTNKITQLQWMYETYLSLFNDAKTSYNNIKVIVRPGGSTELPYSGEDAIKQYSGGAKISKEDLEKLEKELESVLRVMNYFFQKLKLAEIQEKDFMVYIVIEFYQSYMQEALIKFREKVISDGKDSELGETLILINFCNQHYIDLLSSFQSKI